MGVHREFGDPGLAQIGHDDFQHWPVADRHQRLRHDFGKRTEPGAEAGRQHHRIQFILYRFHKKFRDYRHPRKIIRLITNSITKLDNGMDNAIL